MARKRQIVLMKSRKTGGTAEMEPLGSPQEVIEALARFNTAPDGSPGGALGTLTLYGPGMMVLMATTQPKVLQLMANLTDEEIAMPVLMRACKHLGWGMTDMESGRSFG
jgi:hypothetical protein